MKALSPLALAAALGFLAGAPAAEAQDPPTPPPPDFLNRKDPLPKELLDQKSEGWYFTGIPTIGVDPELGPIVGAEIQIYDNGPKSSPFFAYTPYRREIQAGAQAGVQGNYSSYYLAYDDIYVNDTPWRIKAYVGWRQKLTQDYFGTGEQTLGPLRFPGSPQTYERFSAFQRALQESSGGITWEKYVQYHQRRFLGTFNLEHDYMGGLLRPLVGIQLAHYGVTDYTGRIIDGAIQQETKLAEDNRLGRIRGFDGGWDNLLRVGLAYDTRNYEPDPTSGILAQTLFSGSLRALGSEFNYGQAVFGVSAYTPIIPDYKSLVLAGNAVYSIRFGDVPFIAMNRLALPKDEERTGLGSWPTLRGYRSNRFVGETTIGVNAELRWSFAEFDVFKQHLKLAAAPFVDAGRVFDTTGGFSFEEWKYSYGIGLRLAWNLATVISFDYGISPEESLFFMTLGQAF